MGQKDRAALKLYFETGDFPTEDQFSDFIDSVLNFIDDGTPGDTKAKVSVNDTTSNYLASKFVAGTNITLTINNPAGDETITIDGVAGSFEWSITTNKLANDTITVDYISLFANSVEVARVGDGVDPKIIVDPIGTKGATTGYWFSDGGAGLYQVSQTVLRFRINTIDRYEIGQTSINANTTGSWLLARIVATSTAPTFTFLGDTDTGIGKAGSDQLSLIAGGVEIMRSTTTGQFIKVMKSGATQAAAGALADELWKTSGHATLPDNVVLHGV